MIPIYVTRLDTFNSLVNTLCEFSDDGSFDEAPMRLVGVDLLEELPFISPCGDRWRYVRKYEGPTQRVKLWTAKTAPDNLMIRQRDWTEGAYCNADVGRTGVIINVYSDIARDSSAKTITWQELSDQYEQRDGSACHDVEEIS